MSQRAFSINKSFDRRFWTISTQVERTSDYHTPNCHGGDDCICRESTFVLKVRHYYPEDDLFYVMCVMGDEYRAISLEGQHLMASDLVDNNPDFDGDPLDVVQNTTVCLTLHELNIFLELRRIWDAFALMFNPAITL